MSGALLGTAAHRYVTMNYYKSLFYFVIKIKSLFVRRLR